MIRLILPVLFLLLVAGCCKDPLTDHITLMVDVTDSLNFSFLKANQERIIRDKLIPGIQARSCYTANVRFQRISDVGQNEPQKAILNLASSDLTEKSIQELAEKFRLKLSKEMGLVLEGEIHSLNESKIYEPLCKEIKRLSNLKSPGRKAIILFSDLLENSTHYSLYHKDPNPDPVAGIQTLEKAFNCECKNLAKDIEIFVVCQRNPSNDEMIRKAEKFWTPIFTQQFSVKSFNHSSDLEF